MAAARTARKQRGRPFEKGQSGNPAGRPKGSKDNLSEAFLAGLSDDFTKHGTAVIAKVRQKAPAVYLRVVADLVPKDFNVNARMSLSEEFETYIRGLSEQGAAA